MHRLSSLSVDDLVQCSSVFRAIGAEAESMEAAAQSITDYLHRHLVDDDGQPAAPLVRLYKSHRFGELDPELQDFAAVTGVGHLVQDDTRCLTLLGTSGDEPAWNNRRRSAGHRAIPLVSEEVVAQSPMIAGLVSELGLDVSSLVAPSEAQTITLHHRDYDVFFVPEAEGSPLVPAQEDFVLRYGIRSVVGCGGMLPSGDLFALIVFARISLSPETADLFRTLALSIKATIVPYTFKVFREAS